MGQKVNPHGFRVGVIKDWDSRWYADKKEFADNLLLEDHKLRRILKEKIILSWISKIEIERQLKELKLNIHTAKPGVVIGKGWCWNWSIKSELEKID